MSTLEDVKAYLRQRNLRLLYAFLILGSLGVVLIGNTQVNDLKNSNTPSLTKAQVECFNQMRELKVDVTGARGAICRGK